MAAVTIRSDFGAQEEEMLSLPPSFPLLFAMQDGGGCQDLSFFNI